MPSRPRSRDQRGCNGRPLAPNNRRDGQVGSKRCKAEPTTGAGLPDQATQRGEARTLLGASTDFPERNLVAVPTRLLILRLRAPSCRRGEGRFAACTRL